jgi:hypothetical protein
MLGAAELRKTKTFGRTLIIQMQGDMSMHGKAEYMNGQVPVDRSRMIVTVSTLHP